VTAIGVF